MKCKTSLLFSIVKVLRFIRKVLCFIRKLLSVNHILVYEPNSTSKVKVSEAVNYLKDRLGLYLQEYWFSRKNSLAIHIL